MPRYTSKKKAAAKRRRKTVTKSISRDKRILKNWAVRGTARDYEKVRQYAAKFEAEAPDYVHVSEIDKLKNATRRSMLEDLHGSGGDDNSFTNALAWLWSKVPGANAWKWGSQLYTNSMKGFKGDSITEQDEDYAKLTSATYRDDRPEVVEHWTRLVKYDSNYCAVWQNRDGHLYIAVRGTEMAASDLLQDMSIMMAGRVPFVKEVAEEMQRILKDVDPDVIVDAGGHSLGTTLLLQAYDTPGIKDRIRQTFLFNPAASPIAEVGTGAGNITEKYERDNTVRYFVNLSDLVSSGLLGDEGPVNVVYRTGSPLHPMTAHSIDEWYPGTYDELDKAQLTLEKAKDEFGNDVGPVGPDDVDDNDQFFSVRFGEDDWMQSFNDRYGTLFGDASHAAAASTRPVRVIPLGRGRAPDDRIHDTGFSAPKAPPHDR